MPLGGCSTECTNRRVYDQVVSGGCRSTEPNLDLRDHELKAVRLEDIEAKIDRIERIDTSNLEVRDVHRVVDVVVRIEFVESNSVRSHVRSHT